MRTLRRYVLLQLPGWMLAAVVLAAARREGWIGAGLAAALFLAWVGKDFLFYPFLRRSYESRAPTGAERLIGRVLRARTAIAPRGYVTADGELWRAELLPGAAPVPAGAALLVRGHRGLTLLVERAPDLPAGGPLPERD